MCLNKIGEKMFLNRLSLDQRKAFIDLTYHAANIDGIYAEQEKQLIDLYKSEAGIPYYQSGKLSLEDCLCKFDSAESRRILIIEMTALVYSDGEVTIEENKLLKQISEKLALADSDIDFSKSWVENYYKQVYSANEFISR